jgi:hypothetical protein
MRNIRWMIGKRAARATVRHSAHGVAAKARRKPLRSSTLLGVGMAIGAAASWVGARRLPAR